MTITPQQSLLDSHAALNDAIDQLLPLAQKRIAIFDIDLRDTHWDSAARHDVIAQFLLASPAHRLHILLHDTDYVAGFLPRIMRLLQQFSDRMEIRRSNEEARHAFDPFVLVDGQHYLHRFHYEQTRAEFCIAQPRGGHALSLRFEELWNAAGPALTATVLGL
jgi:hypothetical protein